MILVSINIVYIGVNTFTELHFIDNILPHCLLLPTEYNFIAIISVAYALQQAKLQNYMMVPAVNSVFSIFNLVECTESIGYYRRLISYMILI